jgi:serine/threonine protein kinase KIN1/2
MAAYPTVLAPLTQVAEEGAITPSHGGIVHGHEFDIPITQKPYPSPASFVRAATPVRDHQPPQPVHSTPPVTPRHPSLAAPQGAVPRRTSSAHKPRPISMPPSQGFATSGSSERDRQVPEQNGRHSRRPDAEPASKPRTTNRILGDYTLSKTLGAGSMGKVKLAHHNITGEKVSPSRAFWLGHVNRELGEIPFALDRPGGCGIGVVFHAPPPPC